MSNLSQADFIKNNVLNGLMAMGYPRKRCVRVAENSVEKFKTRSFAMGEVFSTIMREAQQEIGPVLARSDKQKELLQIINQHDVVELCQTKRGGTTLTISM